MNVRKKLLPLLLAGSLLVGGSGLYGNNKKAESELKSNKKIESTENTLDTVVKEEQKRPFFNLRVQAGPAQYKSDQVDAKSMVYVGELLLNFSKNFAIRAEHNTFSLEKTNKATNEKKHLDAHVERVGLIVKPLRFLTVDIGYNHTNDIDHIRPYMEKDRGKKSAQGIRTEWGLVIPGKNTILVGLDYLKTKDKELYRTITAGLLHEFNKDKTYMIVRYQNIHDTYLNQDMHSGMGWLHHRSGPLEVEVGGSIGDQKSAFGSLAVYPVNGLGFLVSGKTYRDKNVDLSMVQGGLKLKF